MRGAVAMRLLKKIHPSFYLLLGWFILSRNLLGFVTFAAVVFTHELGHYFVAKRLGYKLASFAVAPYGVSLNYKERTFEGSDEVKIAIAGPAVNLIIAVFLVSLWWLLPASYYYTQEIVLQSIFLALFNLLPAYPMDGGRIFAGLISSRMPRKKVMKILSISNIVFSIIFFALFILSCFISFNPTFALAGIFMILGLIESKNECRYEAMNIFKKKIKNFSRPLIFTCDDSVTLGALVRHISINRYTIFYIQTKNKTRIVDEALLQRWSLIYPYDTTLAEIFSSLSRKV